MIAYLGVDDVVTAARSLLGRRLRSTVGGTVCEVVLTEVEAYGGRDDPASHGFRGRTPRNASMFAGAGILYVYRSYGIHWCMNVVTGSPGTASAVLLRAGRPVVGEQTMVERRRRADHVADGPGKLSQALGVTGDHDGLSLFGGGEVRLLEDPPAAGTIAASARIGVGAARTRPWRFVLRDPE